jgi:hypothetical protein
MQRTGAQFFDTCGLLLIIGLFGSFVRFITSLLVAGFTCAIAKRQGRPRRSRTKASVMVAGMIALVQIALLVGANLGLDIGLW